MDASSMNFDELNWLAIAIAIVVNMGLGFLWYSPKTPTGKVWMRDQGMDPDAPPKPTGGQMAKGLILMVIGSFLMFFVFAHNFWVYEDAYRNAGTGGDPEYDLSVMDGVFGALFTWLGFFVPVMFSSVAWENKSWALFFVNSGYYLVSLLVAGILLVTI
jgi:hypothetical protein